MIGIVATKCARWVRRFPCSLGPSPRRPTASFNLAAVWCGDCVRASWLYSQPNAPIATWTIVLPRTAPVPGRLCSVRLLLDYRPMPFFDLIIRQVESSYFGPKSDDSQNLSTAIGFLKSDYIPSDSAKSDCVSRPILFSDRKIKIRSSESDRILNGLGQK